MITSDATVDLIRNAVLTVIIVGAPPLVMGLTVGIIASMLQTITSIQEATLAFVPKIIAVLLALIIFGHFMLNTLQDFFISTMSLIPTFLT